MKKWKKHSDEFDHAEDVEILMRADAAAANYQLATGIPCRIISGKQIDANRDDFCFCKIANDYSEERISPFCGRNHFHSIKQAEKFGGSYIYFCSSFLIYWTSPIMKEGRLVGAFIAGPAMIVTTDEVIEEWKKIYPGIEDHLFLSYLAEIPQLSTERSRSLAELLLIYSSWIMDTEEYVLIEREQFLYQQSRISEHIQELKNTSKKKFPLAYPVEKETELLSAISRGNRDQAQRILNEILGSVFFASGRDFTTIKFRILELIVLLSRAAIDGGAKTEDVLASNYRYLKDIEQFKDIDNLAFWLSRILNQFCTLVFNLHEKKHADRLARTLQYINSNYTEKITLEDAASYAALSPAYFSKIFKEEMSYSFTEYINRIRVDHAKTLLRSSSCTLIEISGLVGFDDQSYFSRVFKRITGGSPGKYRDQGGKISLNTHEIHS